MRTKDDKRRISIYPFFAYKNNDRSDLDIINGHKVLSRTFKSINDHLESIGRDLHINYPFDLDTRKEGVHIYWNNSEEHKGNGKRMLSHMDDVINREVKYKTPAELVVFYLAGHGKNDHRTQEYYFDVDCCKGGERYVKGQDIYQKLMKLNEISPTLLVIDTCYDIKASDLFKKLEKEVNKQKLLRKSINENINTNAELLSFDFSFLTNSLSVNEIKSASDLDQFITQLKLKSEKRLPKKFIQSNKVLDNEFRIMKKSENEALQLAIELRSESVQIFSPERVNESNQINGRNITNGKYNKNISLIFSMNNRVYETSLGFRYGVQIICAFLSTYSNISLKTFYRLLREFLYETTTSNFNTFSSHHPPYITQLDVLFPKDMNDNIQILSKKFDDLEMINYKKPKKS